MSVSSFIKFAAVAAMGAGAGRNLDAHGATSNKVSCTAGTGNATTVTLSQYAGATCAGDPQSMSVAQGTCMDTVSFACPNGAGSAPVMTQFSATGCTGTETTTTLSVGMCFEEDGDDDDDDDSGKCPGDDEQECSGQGFKDKFSACQSCSAPPTDCAALIKMVSADGCYGKCAYGMTDDGKDLIYAQAGCTAAEKEEAAKAIDEAEAEHEDEGDATSAGLSVAAACALAVASLYHM